MMDEPLPEEEGHTSSFPSSALHHPKIYETHRRERRQTGIVHKNFYELMTPSQGRISPMGRIAKQLMKQVLKAKGKEEKDVVPSVHF
jgi:hypothetical protein